VEHARRISAVTGAELIFLHVVMPDAPFGCAVLPVMCANELEETAEENLRGLVRPARNGDRRNARPVIRRGLPAHEVVEAKDSDVDLIVIATHGYTGWKHFCIGSTAERGVRAAPCPVLVVREKEHELV
jgi:universal stress protein A